MFQLSTFNHLGFVYVWLFIGKGNVINMKAFYIIIVLVHILLSLFVMRGLIFLLKRPVWADVLDWTICPEILD